MLQGNNLCQRKGNIEEKKCWRLQFISPIYIRKYMYTHHVQQWINMICGAECRWQCSWPDVRSAIEAKSGLNRTNMSPRTRMVCDQQVQVAHSRDDPDGFIHTIHTGSMRYTGGWWWSTKEELEYIVIENWIYSMLLGEWKSQQNPCCQSDLVSLLQHVPTNKDSIGSCTWINIFCLNSKSIPACRTNCYSRVYNRGCSCIGDFPIIPGSLYPPNARLSGFWMASRWPHMDPPMSMAHTATSSDMQGVLRLGYYPEEVEQGSTIDVISLKDRGADASSINIGIGVKDPRNRSDLSYSNTKRNSNRLYHGLASPWILTKGVLTYFL